MRCISRGADRAEKEHGREAHGRKAIIAESRITQGSGTPCV